MRTVSLSTKALQPNDDDGDDADDQKPSQKQLAGLPRCKISPAAAPAELGAAACSSLQSSGDGPLNLPGTIGLPCTRIAIDNRHGSNLRRVLRPRVYTSAQASTFPHAEQGE